MRARASSMSFGLSPARARREFRSHDAFTCTAARRVIRPSALGGSGEAGALCARIGSPHVSKFSREPYSCTGRVSCIRIGSPFLARSASCLGAGWLGRTPAGSAQADAKQHITIAAAHLDTVVLVVAFARERREEQLTMRVGMLARRVIVGELHANFVADALAPEIPVEVIVGQGKLLSTQKNEERPRCPSSGRYLARNAAF